MQPGRHALPPRVIRAWRVLIRPAVLIRTAAVVLVVLAAVAGSLIVLAVRHADQMGLAASLLLGALTLAAAAAAGAGQEGNAELPTVDSNHESSGPEPDAQPVELVGTGRDLDTRRLPEIRHWPASRGRGGIRTLTPFRAPDFEAGAVAVTPPARRAPEEI